MYMIAILPAILCLQTRQCHICNDCILVNTRKDDVLVALTSADDIVTLDSVEECVGMDTQEFSLTVNDC